MKKRIIITAVTISLALLMAGGGTYWWQVYRFLQSTDNAYAQGNITPINAKVSDYAVQVLVEDHQLVEKGDILLKIAPEQFTLQVENARETIAIREAAIEALKQRHTAQQLTIEQAAEDYKAADAAEDLADSDLKRVSNLAAHKFISKQKYDSAKTDKIKTLAAQSKSMARVKAEQQQLMVLESDLKQAHALLSQAKVALKIAHDNLKGTIVVAPADGRIVKKSIQKGQFVRAGALLMSLVPSSGRWIEANYKETQLNRIRPGQKARIQIDAYPDNDITGEVESISPSTGALFSLLPPENATGNFTKVVQRLPVRIKLSEESASKLQPGLSVNVTIDTR